MRGQRTSSTSISAPPTCCNGTDSWPASSTGTCRSTALARATAASMWPRCSSTPTTTTPPAARYGTGSSASAARDGLLCTWRISCYGRSSGRCVIARAAKRSTGSSPSRSESSLTVNTSHADLDRPLGSGVGPRDPRRTDIQVTDGESMSGARNLLDPDLGEERFGARGEQVRVEGFAFSGDEQCYRHRDCSELVIT